MQVIERQRELKERSSTRYFTNLNCFLKDQKSVTVKERQKEGVRSFGLKRQIERDYDLRSVMILDLILLSSISKAKKLINNDNQVYYDISIRLLIKQIMKAKVSMIVS